jgi:hypothetical protein
MRQISGFLTSFFREYGNVRFYLLQSVFYGAAVWANYGWDIERSAVRSMHASWILVGWYAGFYALPFLFTCVTYAWCYRTTVFLRSSGFWSLAACAIGTLSVNGAVHVIAPPIHTWFVPEVQYFIFRCVNNLRSTAVYAAMIAACWWIKDRREMPLYGLTTETFSPRPFLAIVLLASPLIVAASFQGDFLASYPRFTSSQAADFWGIPRIIPVGVYELCYGLDFVATEFFFRGFMVLAFARYLGPAAVFPMVSVYLFLHFEKPMAEAISSVFGGLALGIIAFRTRSIFGGVIVHLGIAWMMETAAFAQLLIRTRP